MHLPREYLNYGRPSVKVSQDVGATGNSASAPRQIRMSDILEKKKGCHPISRT